MQLKVNGKPLDEALKKSCPALERARDFLDQLPADELITTDELRKKVGIADSSIRRWKDEMADYRQQVMYSMLWGNPRAIKELRKQVGK